MDLQTRKLNTIGYLIGLNDEKLFQKIESIIFEFTKNPKPKLNLPPFTQQQLIDRAKTSNSDYENGKVKNQEQLEKESENW